ncbi:hypothetical protein ACGFIY_10145 [Micromonospora chersina]|uniref:hypothetical protein n=1 Tax=Micromonospora chersina TaxID=47854 RepID=UPI00371F7F19
MCEYAAIRAAAGQALPLAAVKERLGTLGLREYKGPGTWLTGDRTDDMMVNAEVEATGQRAAAPDDFVVSLDVTRWCPCSGWVARWTDEPTVQAQDRLLKSISEALGWTLVDHNDPGY